MASRILLVDSDRQAVAAVERLLVRAGHRLTALASFEAATRHLSLEAADLLISAVRLGQFNGVHLALRARADHPQLPIILCGDPSDAVVAAEAAAFGARFVATPIEPEQLLTIVTALLATEPVAANMPPLRVVPSGQPAPRSQVTEDQVRAIIHEVQHDQEHESTSPSPDRTTFYQLKERFGWTPSDDAQRLRHLEDENRKLKQIVVDQALDIETLKAAVSRKS